MPYCVTSTMSVNNLNQVRDGNDTSVVSQSDNNNIINNNNNNNNNNKVNNVSKINTTKITGTVSTGNIGRISRGDKEKELNRAPSMAITIPIHPEASEIADREKILPPLLQDFRQNLQDFYYLAIVHILCGALWMFQSLHSMLWTPISPIIYYPYLSNIPLLISGSCGLSLLYCLKREHPGKRPRFWFSATKVFSIFFAILTVIACVSVCVLSAIHLYRFIGMECTPAQVLNATCLCKPRGEPPDSLEVVIRSKDESCHKVGDYLTTHLIFRVLPT